MLNLMLFEKEHSVLTSAQRLIVYLSTVIEIFFTTINKIFLTIDIIFLHQGWGRERIASEKNMSMIQAIEDG